MSVYGGYVCKKCKKPYMNMYQDPCWTPRKSYKGKDKKKEKKK